MPARAVKTLLRNPNERKHREHRSKDGRHPEHYYENPIRDLRMRKVEKRELKEQLKNL